MVPVLPNSLSLPAKIASLQLLGLLWQPFETPPVNLRSCTSARAMSASASRSLSDSQVFATLFPLEQHSQCRLDLLLKY